MDKKELPKIQSYPNYSKCHEHKGIYIRRDLPCPYPNCEHGVSSDSFIDTGFPIITQDNTIEYPYSSTYIRKEWKGLNGTTKYIWNIEEDIYPSIRNIIFDEVYKKIKKITSNEIYHYTKLDTLYKILESNGLRLTEYNYTNDPVEIKHGIELLQKIDNKDVVKIVKKLENNELSFFLASFSDEINKRTLFNEYADNAQGVAIGFDTDYNKENNFWYSDFQLLRLMPVIYEVEVQKKILDFAFYIFEIAKEWIYADKECFDYKNNLISKKERKEVLLDDFTRIVEELIAFFKHDSFDAEKEIRWLYMRDVRIMKSLQYELLDVRNNNNKNYYTSCDIAKASSKSEEHKSIRLPIKSIVLGAKVENKDKTINEIKNKLIECGFNDVSIEISNLPYK
jgi:hypothetical protein